MLWIGWWLACSPVSPSEAGPLPDVSPAPDFVAVRDTYAAQYRLATKAEVPQHLATLCRMVIPGQDGPYHGGGGPGEGITVYVNEVGWPAMQQDGSRLFPPGSVLVKRKSDGSLGLMHKGPGATWTYAYAEADGQLKTDPAALTHCAGCHEHGTVPEEAKALGIRLGDPRDGVFLGANVPPAPNPPPAK